MKMKFLFVDDNARVLRSIKDLFEDNRQVIVAECHSVEEALANLKEATELYLEEFPLKGGGHTFLTTFEARCA